MKAPVTPNILVLGSGQLGLLLDKAAKKLDIPLEALALSQVWETLDEISPEDTLITFEQEHVDEALLHELEARGLRAFPDWKTFYLLRNKQKQKQFLLKEGIPTSPFIGDGSTPAERQAFLSKHKGAVLKAGRGGYDGNGVWFLDKSGKCAAGDLETLWAKIDSPFLEAAVDFDCEAAAVVCRSINGETLLYPTVKSIQKHGICHEVEYTKEFAATKAAIKAGEIAHLVAEKTDYHGVLAVELFLKGDEVFVNEIAPRVHNSGHFTIDVCAGSQFENHIRAGIGWPLESTAPTHPAALMVNLLWPPEEKEFAPLFTRLTCGPELPPEVKLHWYGKSEIRPLRKMGHFTVYAGNLRKCKEIAQQILATRWA